MKQMRRMPSIFRGIIAFLLFATAYTPVHAESIREFASDIRINPSGVIHVSERITYDFGSAEKHGIVREVPFVKRNDKGQKFSLTISGISVSDPKGAPYAYTSSRSSDTIRLKIGDANTYVTGIKDYVVSYDVAGAITYFSDHDELYWNVSGNGSAIPMDSIRATVRLPKVVPGSTVKTACYTGSDNSTKSACDASYNDGAYDFTGTSSFGAGEGLTIVAGFPKGLVAVNEPKEVSSFWDTMLGKICIFLLLAISALGAFLWFVVVPIIIVVQWIRTGRDPVVPLGVASAWFSAPETPSGRKLTPGETGTLVDETADMRDITATIVDMARRGYLKIVETKDKTFVLEKRDDADKNDVLMSFEHTLYSGVFPGKKTEFAMKAGSLADTVSTVKNALYDSVVKEGFFRDNPQKVRNLYIILGVLGVFTMNFPMVIAAFLFGIHMPKKTMVGATTANVAKSLRNFLASQERQLEFQAKNSMMFESLLPYAIVFGVEKIWAKRFAGIDLTPPDWYEGYGNHTAFNPPIFVNSLDRSMRGFMMAATPISSTSSSGFSSGFSGGHSGGGGGGGSVGSW